MALKRTRKDIALERINSLDRCSLNCNKFSIYDYDGFSMQELLCQFFTKINELADSVNTTLELVEWLVNEGLELAVVAQLEIWLNDGTLAEIINETIFNELNAKINNLQKSVDLLTFYGCKGDGVTDDSEPLQNAINFCVANNYNLTCGSDKTYRLTKQIIIPNNGVFNSGCNLLFNNNTFYIDHNVSPFVSGTFIDGVLTPSYNLPSETYYTFGIKFGDFRIKTNDLKNSSVMEIHDWHHGCVIQNVLDESFNTMLKSKNNYYCAFMNLKSLFKYGEVNSSTRYIFERSHNLCVFEELVGTNTGTIYHFTGGVTGSAFNKCSFEGAKIGIQFDGEVYDMVIRDSYFENISDTMIKSTSYVHNLRITNNYLNFNGQPNCAFIDYADVPFNHYLIESDNSFINMLDTNKLFKRISSVTGYSLMDIKEKPLAITNNEIWRTLVDNTKYAKDMVVDKVYISNLNSFKAKAVNDKIIGNYVGSYTDGYMNGITGSKNVTVNTMDFVIDTSFTNIDTALIYVNLKIPTTQQDYYLKGFISNGDFLEMKNDGNMTVSTQTAGDYIQVKVVSPTYQVGVGIDGEVRII